MNAHTVMEYQYRDADNYKAFDLILLSGELTPEQIQEVEALLEDGQFFIAEQLGVLALQERLWTASNGVSVADHAYHELLGFRSATTEEVTTLPVWGSIDDMVANFRRIGNNWDCSLSIYSSIGLSDYG